MTADTSTSQMPQVISALLVCIQKRFSDIEAGLFKCTTIVQLDSWPSDYQDASEFGDEAVSAVVDYFHENLAANNIETSLVEIEWTQLKHLLYKNHTVKQMDWKKINELYHSQCSNILAVFDLMLSLPAGTSECERGFSQMGVVKSKYRNRLHSKTMTLLMTVDLHSAEIAEFDPYPAIHYWNQNGSRRPEFLKHKGKGTDIVKVMQQEIKMAEEDAEAPEVLSGSESDREEESPKYSDYDSNFSDLDESDNDVDE